MFDLRARLQIMHVSHVALGPGFEAQTLSLISPSLLVIGPILGLLLQMCNACSSHSFRHGSIVCQLFPAVADVTLFLMSRWQVSYALNLSLRRPFFLLPDVISL